MGTITALRDVIIPADGRSPVASAVGAPSYVNEHVSAPCDGNQRDLVRVRGALAWINLESRKRFSRDFARLTAAQKSAICHSAGEEQPINPTFPLAHDCVEIHWMASYPSVIGGPRMS